LKEKTGDCEALVRSNYEIMNLKNSLTSNAGVFKILHILNEYESIVNWDIARLANELTLDASGNSINNFFNWVQNFNTLKNVETN
jgi:hypothetical protein